MSDFITHSKKALTSVLAISTIVWSVGLSALIPVNVQAAAGDLVKGSGPAVYQVDADGVTIHPFPHQNVYTSWGFPADFSTTFTTNLSGYTVGNDVEFRDGSLIRALETPAVYVVTGKSLRPIVSAEVFTALGYNWDNITWLPQSFLDKYGTAGSIISSTTTHVNGTVVKYASSSTTYLIQNNAKRSFASSDVVKVNGYASIPVITIPSSETYNDGSMITVRESAFTIPGGVGSAPAVGTNPSTPVGSGLSVSKASDNPAAATILSDSDADTYPQALIPLLAVNFSAGSDGAVAVTTVKFARTGVASDSDLGNLYLYDGGTRLAEYSSFNDKVVTFTNSSGLFTVAAGSTKTVWLKADLARGATSVAGSKTIGFDMLSASSVSTDGAAVSGSFPLAGNLMTTAQVSDLGHVYATSYTTFPATIKADAANQEVWRMTLNSDGQDMQVRKIRMTLVGTIGSSEIRDLKLEVGGVQVGTTQQIAADKTVTFDGLNYEITSGQSKIFVLRANMNGGSGRAFKFTIQRSADVEVYDTNYNVYNTFNITGTTTAFALVQPETGNGTDVDSGTITTGVASDSPSGNIADGATGVTLAKFTFTASGENVKIESLTIDTTSSGNTLTNVKTILEGVGQIGTTDASLVADGTDSVFTYGSTFRVNAGETKTVTILADTTHSSIAADETVVVNLIVGASNAQGLTTLTSLSTTAQTGNTLTVKGGTITAVKNSAFADRTSTNPTGVANTKDGQIASFIITAGSGEAVDVTQIVLKDPGTTTQMGDNFQNLKIKNGSTQIGNTIGTLDSSGTAATYTFTPASAIRIASGAQYVVDVYADIKSSPQDSATVLDTNGVIEIDSVSATGVLTSSDVGVASGHNAALQNSYIASEGNLTMTLDSDSPTARQVVMGSTDQEVARFKLAASASEDITVTDVYLASTVSSGATGSFYNIKLYKNSVAAANQVGTASSFGTTSTTTTAVAPFTGLTLTVPRDGNTILIVVADVSTSANATSADTHQFALVPDYDGATAGNQASITARGQGGVLAAGSIDFSAAPDADVDANVMTVYATKISVAFASDTPSGSAYSAGTDDQIIAKFVVSNTANVSNYAATVKLMNFSLSHSGTSKASATALQIKVYKDSIVAGNLVGNTAILAAQSLNIADTNMAGTGTTAVSDSETTDFGFEDVEIAAGASKTFIVTMDTNNVAMDADAGAEAISIGMAAGDIEWRDGVITSNITTVNSLPLTAKTLNYPAT